LRERREGGEHGEGSDAAEEGFAHGMVLSVVDIDQGGNGPCVDAVPLRTSL
jgi:hypothetical protein